MKTDAHTPINHVVRIPAGPPPQKNPSEANYNCNLTQPPRRLRESLHTAKIPGGGPPSGGGPVRIPILRALLIAWSFTTFILN